MLVRIYSLKKWSGNCQKMYFIFSREVEKLFLTRLNEDMTIIKIWDRRLKFPENCIFKVSSRQEVTEPSIDPNCQKALRIAELSLISFDLKEPHQSYERQRFQGKGSRNKIRFDVDSEGGGNYVGKGRRGSKNAVKLILKRKP